MSHAGNFWRLYLRNLRQIPRIPTVLVFGIVMPVIQLLLFGSIFENVVPTGEEQGYFAFITPAIILLTAFLGMANASAALLVDLRTGYFDKLRTTPVNAGGIVVARLLAEMTRVSGQALIIVLLSLLFGTRAVTGALGFAAMIFLAVLFSAMTTGLMTTALAMKTRSDQATQSAFPLFFVFIFLSTAYVPVDFLPKWLQYVVMVNPVDYMIRGFRALQFDGWAEAIPTLGIGLGIATIVLVILGLVNLRVYRRNVMA